MKTIGFEKVYSDATNYVIVEQFEDGSSREVSTEYIGLKNWSGDIPLVAGNTYVTISGSTVTYDSTGASAAATTAAWEQVRGDRNARIAAIEWRAARYERQVAAGITTNDTAEQYQAVLVYIQALRDITKQADPTAITWPEVPA
ncbi:MAG: phage tail assembly chaperone [Methanoregula sp.]|nr:phage tail assembly chaperone [Methanoregula sp.]